MNVSGAVKNFQKATADGIKYIVEVFVLL